MRYDRIILQHRDSIPSIVFPDHIALFGGKIEAGESAEEGALRELREELELALSLDDLHLFMEIAIPEADKIVHIFYATEIDHEKLILHEGQAIIFLEYGADYPEKLTDLSRYVISTYRYYQTKNRSK